MLIAVTKNKRFSLKVTQRTGTNDLFYFLNWGSEWMCCTRGKALQLSWSRTLTLYFKFLHKNILKIVDLIYTWNLGFLSCSWRHRGLFTGKPFLPAGRCLRRKEAHWQSAYISLRWQLKFCSWFLSSWSYMKQKPYVCNLADSAVNKQYNIGQLSVWE